MLKHSGDFHENLQGFGKKKHYRDLCFTPFPVMFTCTLQGFSGTQGSPVKFTVKTFAVNAHNKPPV